MFYSESDSTTSTQTDGGNLPQQSRLRQRQKPRENNPHPDGETHQNAETQTQRQSIHFHSSEGSSPAAMRPQSIHRTSNIARGVTVETGGPLQQVYQLKSMIDVNEGGHKFDWMTRGGNKEFRFSTGLQQYDNFAFASDDPIYGSVYCIPAQDKMRNNRSVPITFSETAKLARQSTMHTSELHLESEQNSETASRDLPAIPEGSTHQFSEDEGYSEGVWATAENYQVIEQVLVNNTEHLAKPQRGRKSGKKNAKKMKKGATCNSSSSMAAILPEENSEIVSVRGRDENGGCCIIL